MEKEKIMIHRICENVLIEKTDEAAIEQRVCISLKNGEEIWVTCTPSYLAEMTAARKYLAGDWAEDAAFYENVSLKNVSLREIFRISRDAFENPGPLFTDTGCAHSCALVYEGKVACCIEDIGRHNALDKVIGYALLHKIPFSGAYVFTSGRISEDYLQKVAAAGFPMVVSRAAVTANAVRLAKAKNITLLGFIRKNTGNLYWEGAVKIGCDVE